MSKQKQVIKSFDSISIKSHLSYLDSISNNQVSIGKSLDSLNAIILKESKEEKICGKYSYDTVFTVITTISIFAVGIIIDRIIKYCDKLKQERQLQRYFKYYLDKIADKTCKLLAEIYRKTYLENDINKGIPTSSPKILTGDFQRIRNINDKELFHTFSSQQSFSSILSNLDFIEKITEEVDKYHNGIRLATDEIRKPLQDKVNEYFSVLAEYVEHIRVNNPQYANRDAFKNLVNSSILLNHKQIAGTGNIKKLYREIIRPIQEMVVKTNIFRLDPIALKIADLGKEISVSYNYLKKVTIDFRLDYRRFYQEVIKSQKTLIDERAKIKWR